METIAHGMMDLHGEGQQYFSTLVDVFPHREHGGKKVLHIGYVDIKTGKT
jgi:hypothetical protein